MLKVPFFNLSRQYDILKPEIQEAIEAVITKNAFSGGPFVAEFEAGFAKYSGTKYCIGVNSGTAAIHLAAEASGIGAGDEVIIPANTYIATAMGTSHAGGTPVFADCDAKTWNLDPNDIEHRITEKTKAIMPVHLFGQPCDMDAIMTIAKKHNLLVIEDSAQAHGSTYKGKPIGTFGNTGCYSFYPSKNLGSFGEGGGITTDNADLAKYLQSMKDYGRPDKFTHAFVGYNERMHGMQAAVLNVKLSYIAEWNTLRQAIAGYYLDNINNDAVTMQHQPEFAKSVFHLFVVTVDNRDAFTKYLEENGVGWSMHYPIPCHLQPCYAELGYKKGDLPNAEYLSDNCVTLPLFPEMTQEEIERVIEVVNNYGG